MIISHFPQGGGASEHGLGMRLYYDDQGNLTMTPAKADKGVDHYVVAVYYYVNKFNAWDDVWAGMTTFGAQEKLINGNTAITLKKYGVCDFDEADVSVDPEEICGLTVVRYNDIPYYWLSLTDEYFYYSISSNPSLSKKDQPEIVVLSGFDANGIFLGTVTAEPMPTGA